MESRSVTGEFEQNARRAADMGAFRIARRAHSTRTELANMSAARSLGFDFDFVKC
jgi:hypothetical protein